MYDTLNTFCEMSREKVNISKTQVHFSANVNQEFRVKIANLAGFSIADDMEKCLSILVFHDRASKNIFDFVIGSPII